jgi:hypothetical protein
MALTGLQIQKLLPATNCKECGSNTCLAFAMKLAGKKAELAQCPYASDEAKRVLGAASEPPVRCVELGLDVLLHTRPATPGQAEADMLTDGRVDGEVFTQRHPTREFYEACSMLPALHQPQTVLSFGLFRTSRLIEILDALPPAMTTAWVSSWLRRAA